MSIDTKFLIFDSARGIDENIDRLISSYSYIVDGLKASAPGGADADEYAYKDILLKLQKTFIQLVEALRKLPNAVGSNWIASHWEKLIGATTEIRELVEYSRLPIAPQLAELHLSIRPHINRLSVMFLKEVMYADVKAGLTDTLFPIIGGIQSFFASPGRFTLDTLSSLSQSVVQTGNAAVYFYQQPSQATGEAVKLCVEASKIVYNRPIYYVSRATAEFGKFWLTSKALGAGAKYFQLSNKLRVGFEYISRQFAQIAHKIKELIDAHRGVLTQMTEIQYKIRGISSEIDILKQATYRVGAVTPPHLFKGFGNLAIGALPAGTLALKRQEHEDLEKQLKQLYAQKERLNSQTASVFKELSEAILLQEKNLGNASTILSQAEKKERPQKRVKLTDEAYDLFGLYHLRFVMSMELKVTNSKEFQSESLPADAASLRSGMFPPSTESHTALTATSPATIGVVPGSGT